MELIGTIKDMMIMEEKVKAVSILHMKVRIIVLRIMTLLMMELLSLLQGRIIIWMRLLKLKVHGI